MEISEKGIKFLKDCEGFKESPYQCSAKAWTIGYGSTYYLDGTKVRKTDPIISEHDADLLMRHTLGNYQDAINSLLIVNLTQNQYDAIISFVYNIGLGAFKESTILKRINANPKDERIRAEFLRWNKEKDPKTSKWKEDEGLTNRRKKETDLYFN